MALAAFDEVNGRAYSGDASSDDDRRRAGKVLIAYVFSYVWSHLWH